MGFKLAGHPSSPGALQGVLGVGFLYVVDVAVDSKKLEYEPGTIYDEFPSSLGFAVGGQPYSNFLASTV